MVLDGGSWKEGLDALLPFVTYALDHQTADPFAPARSYVYLRRSHAIHYYTTVNRSTEPRSGNNRYDDYFIEENEFVTPEDDQEVAPGVQVIPMP